MKGVSGHIIPAKSDLSTAPKQLTGWEKLELLIFSPFLLISFLYKLLIMLPYQPSRFIGLIRFLFWGWIFYVPNHTELFDHYFAGHDSIRLASPIFTLATFILTALSFLIMLGFSRSIQFPESPTVSGFGGDMPNTSFTIRQIEWRLSNQTQRNQFLKKLFGD